MATALALPIVAIILLSSLLRRPGFAKLGLMAGAVVILVTGLVFGLPAQDASGQPLPTFAPMAPQAEPRNGGTDLALDAPFQIQFTKPMNESTVEANVRISPSTALKYRWDATGQILSILPAAHWAAQTQYLVMISTAATDQQGLALAKEISVTFESGSPTAGTITATQMVDAQISPATAFQVTFTRPVKLASVLLSLWIRPQVPVTVVGDDPTDAASQVFTMTPKETLESKTTYVVGFTDGVADSSGSPISAVPNLTVQTLEGPAVVRFRPLDGDEHLRHEPADLGSVHGAHGQAIHSRRLLRHDERRGARGQRLLGREQHGSGLHTQQEAGCRLHRRGARQHECPIRGRHAPRLGRHSHLQGPGSDFARRSRTAPVESVRSGSRPRSTTWP